MVGTLASAGVSYLFKWILFVVLALGVNITLALYYFDNITALLNGSNPLLGAITLATVLIFPIIWLFKAKKEALFSAIFKVVNEGLDDVVAFIIDTFLTDDNRERVGNYEEVLKQQSKITQKVLGFIFEKIDFLKEAQRLQSMHHYSDEELKAQMVKHVEEQDLFDRWEPSGWTPLILLALNVGVVVIATKLLG